MDLSRVFQTLFRMLFWPVLKHGIDFAARRGKDEAEMTPQEHEQARSARDLAKRAQKIARLARRWGR